MREARSAEDVPQKQKMAMTIDMGSLGVDKGEIVGAKEK